MYVIDGMHRLRAAMLRGEREIDVLFFDGDEGSSFVLAVKANTMHGLPLSLADRKAAASRIISFFPHWSDRMVASVTGLSAKAVATARRTRPSGAKPHLDKRVGRDGRARPVHPKSRRKVVVEAIRDNPEASLRQIARIAGVSPETARTVRASMTLGGEPGHTAPSLADLRGDTAEPNVPDIGPRQEQRTSPPDYSPDITALWQRLAADPAFRSTEAGRSLLRMLAAARALEEQRADLVRAIPAYYLREVGEIARSCALQWQKFSQLVDQDMPSAQPESPLMPADPIGCADPGDGSRSRVIAIRRRSPSPGW